MSRLESPDQKPGELIEKPSGWLVMKFGGTSVSSQSCWNTIATQAGQALASGKKVLIVVSALSGVTDLLNRLVREPDAKQRDVMLKQVLKHHTRVMGDQLLDEAKEFQLAWQRLTTLHANMTFPCSTADLAEISATGEMMSSAAGYYQLRKAGLDVQLQDARKWLKTRNTVIQNPLSVRCVSEANTLMQKSLSEMGSLHITQGFIAEGPDGSTCLLGRGGSDTSAACFAAQLQAQALEIWTDVPGMFTADPHVVSEACLLNRLGYEEAQELASMGAKVLHPSCIQPVRENGIPVYIKNTHQPELQGTLICASDRQADAQVKGVVSRSGITLITMEDPGMWQQSGFLADAFAIFKKHAYSVDLISTSESTVTVSLDSDAVVEPDEKSLTALCEDLSKLCRIKLHQDCVSISLVGNGIRTILGQLAAALDVFQDRHVYLVSQSANDLNLTLVVDAEHAVSLVRKLHQLLISSQVHYREEFGPSWSDFIRPPSVASEQVIWWEQEAEALVRKLENHDCAYVYHLETIREAARRLQDLRSISRVLYSAKANDHPEIVRAIAQLGMGFECVSMEEVRHVQNSVPDLKSSDILFTPNFAPREEYESGFELGVHVTVDNAWALFQWPETFKGKDIFLRLDLDSGYGHHKKVITSGKGSKFGIDLGDIEALVHHLAIHDIRVTGLHAHTGSGVIDTAIWGEQLKILLAALQQFPDVKVLDLGGGIGVPDRPGQAGFNLPELDELLLRTMGESPIELWLEPGRYLVAQSGVLLARVTQLKDKGQYHYVGVATGMNSLIRPALYGSYHQIVNLSRLGEDAKRNCRIVGPICESGDVLGESRMLPECQEGDVILIANAGAYGRVMASSYNRRPPAMELIYDTKL